VTERRAPQYKLSSGSILEAKSEVRSPSGQEMRRERTGDVNVRMCKPRRDRIEVESLGDDIHVGEPMGG